MTIYGTSIKTRFVLTPSGSPLGPQQTWHDAHLAKQTKETQQTTSASQSTAPSLPPMDFQWIWWISMDFDGCSIDFDGFWWMEGSVEQNPSQGGAWGGGTHLGPVLRLPERRLPALQRLLLLVLLPLLLLLMLLVCVLLLLLVVLLTIIDCYNMYNKQL